MDRPPLSATAESGNRVSPNAADVVPIGPGRAARLRRSRSGDGPSLPNPGAEGGDDCVVASRLPGLLQGGQQVGGRHEREGSTVGGGIVLSRRREDEKRQHVSLQAPYLRDVQLS